jgi:DNA adenine methylase
VVWAALGQPKHYLEPFAGSCAVLLARPGFDPTTYMETVNDADGFIANVWRSLQLSPDETAQWCDWPVNHCDLRARKAEIIKNEGRLLEGLNADPKWHDPIQAGYWIWAASCWIGSGLACPGQIPHVSDGGKGVHAMGQIPHVSHGGQGVHAMGQIPHVSHGGKGEEVLPVTAPYNTNIYAWFRRLSERLRYVRVVCGDWTRVCGGDWQDKCGVCGLFLDPPYAHDIGRRKDIYHHESANVSRDVAAWAIPRGERDTYRLVIAGYADEHPNLIAAGWRVHTWTAQGGYAHAGAGGNTKTRGNDNRHREALFMSPHCLNPEQVAGGLFAEKPT